MDLFIKSDFSSLAHIAYHSGPPQARSKHCSQTDCFTLITCTPWICCCLVTKLCLTFYDAMACSRRRQWHPTPVLLPGKSHGRSSLVGCSPWGHEELDMTERLTFSLFTFMHWRRKWQPTPVFLPGESQGWRSLVGYRLWGRTESDTTEAT